MSEIESLYNMRSQAEQIMAEPETLSELRRATIMLRIADQAIRDHHGQVTLDGLEHDAI